MTQNNLTPAATLASVTYDMINDLLTDEVLDNLTKRNRMLIELDMETLFSEIAEEVEDYRIKAALTQLEEDLAYATADPNVEQTGQTPIAEAHAYAERAYYTINDEDELAEWFDLIRD